MSRNNSAGFFFRMITTTLAIMLTAYVLPGVHVKDIIAAILLSLVLAFLNLIVKPLLVLLTLPITIFTFGLFLLVVNAIIIQLASGIVPGFSVDGFWWAFLFSILLSITVSVLDALQSSFGNKNN